MFVGGVCWRCLLEVFVGGVCFFLKDVFVRGVFEEVFVRDVCYKCLLNVFVKGVC